MTKTTSMLPVIVGLGLLGGGFGVPTPALPIANPPGPLPGKSQNGPRRRRVPRTPEDWARFGAAERKRVRKLRAKGLYTGPVITGTDDTDEAGTSADTVDASDTVDAVNGTRP